MATSGAKEQNGHQHRPAQDHSQGPSVGKRVSKTRSSPRPTSIGVTSGKYSTPVHRHHDTNATRTASPPASNSLKPQSWSEATADCPIANRVKIRDKLRPVSATMAGKLRQQRERRRTKRREPYMPSTEGTSTGDEGEELFQMDNVHNSNVNAEDKSRHRYSLQQQRDIVKGPPSTAVSRRYSSPGNHRVSKSPSDLDADDEDNQDYDSASIISASEISQTRARVPNNSTVDDDAVFNAQFQEIRMAGMQQLADIDGTAVPSVEEQIEKLLEKERREKSALIQELGQKEQRIYEMEKLVVDLNRRLLDFSVENERLKAENRALLQAVAKLSAVE